MSEFPGMRGATVLRKYFIAWLTLAMCCRALRAQSADDNELLNGWLNAQTNIQTWSADFTQTRTLKALTQPLNENGHVWFAAPNRFHWELGSPAKTIAVRQSEQLMVIYPKLKRAEKYPLNDVGAGPMKDTLALLDAGFPRSRAEVESRFNILSQMTADNVHEVTLQPKAESARRIMPQIRIGFETKTFALHSTELQFADGSTMKNVFANAVLNPKVDETLFNPEIGADYKITQPFKK
jgi:outer membrane lipoprotein-sorting protein